VPYAAFLRQIASAPAAIDVDTAAMFSLIDIAAAVATILLLPRRSLFRHIDYAGAALLIFFIDSLIRFAVIRHAMKFRHARNTTNIAPYFTQHLWRHCRYVTRLRCRHADTKIELFTLL